MPSVAQQLVPGWAGDSHQELYSAVDRFDHDSYSGVPEAAFAAKDMAVVGHCDTSSLPDTPR